LGCRAVDYPVKYTEHIEQVKFVQRVRHLRHDLLLFAVPNGGYRHPKEAARLKAEGVLAGVPDIIVARATKKYHGLYLEFKTASGRTSDKQKKVIATLELEGYCVKVVRSCDKAWKALMEYLGEDDG